MLLWRNWLECKGIASACSLCIVLGLLSASASSQPLPSTTPTGASTSADNIFVPKGAFGKSASEPKTVATVTPAPVKAFAGPSEPSAPIVPRVLLYASPTTRAFFATSGFDVKDNLRTWEVFLRKYKIPYLVLTSVEQLEKSPSGVLLLPSTVAMSDREMQAVINFRTTGGSVLATWLTGVRNEGGEWRGFGFMESALDVKVVGSTESDEHDNFMIVHGDNPVAHSLPAGMRVWLERVKNWYPLRLFGRNSAAQIMGWTRAFVPGKPTATIVFDERSLSNGKLSRSVVLGYPERLWSSAYPHLIEAVAHNALMWLLRQPDVYVSAWPAPYTSAFVMAVYSPDVIDEVDLDFAKQLEAAGGHATYYVLSENAKKAANIVKQIQSRGHEVGFMGDRFKGFKDQPLVEQAKRFDTMRREFKEAGIDVAPDVGFYAPMESFDKNTEKLLKERSFGHYVAFMDASEARLPFVAPIDVGMAKPAKPLVVLPRTQSGPEDEESEGATGMRDFLSELAHAEQMAGLSVVRIPNQTVLDKAQVTEMFSQLKARRDRMWIASASQVADWWRERERVSANLETGDAGPLLVVSIAGSGPLKPAATVWVNLPQSGGTLRLVARDGNARVPRITGVDARRVAVVLEGFAPGEYRWTMYFDRPIASGAK